jgi:hypothetical protein
VTRGSVAFVQLWAASIYQIKHDASSCRFVAQGGLNEPDYLGLVKRRANPAKSVRSQPLTWETRSLIKSSSVSSNPHWRNAASKFQIINSRFHVIPPASFADPLLDSATAIRCPACRQNGCGSLVTQRLNAGKPTSVMARLQLGRKSQNEDFSARRGPARSVAGRRQ